MCIFVIVLCSYYVFKLCIFLTSLYINLFYVKYHVQLKSILSNMKSKE